MAMRGDDPAGDRSSKWSEIVWTGIKALILAALAATATAVFAFSSRQTG